jgi:hypothetical protein
VGFTNTGSAVNRFNLLKKRYNLKLVSKIGSGNIQSKTADVKGNMAQPKVAGTKRGRKSETPAADSPAVEADNDKSSEEEPPAKKWVAINKLDKINKRGRSKAVSQHEA